MCTLIIPINPNVSVPMNEFLKITIHYFVYGARTAERSMRWINGTFYVSPFSSFVFHVRFALSTVCTYSIGMSSSPNVNGGECVHTSFGIPFRRQLGFWFAAPRRKNTTSSIFMRMLCTTTATTMVTRRNENDGAHCAILFLFDVFPSMHASGGWNDDSHRMRVPLCAMYVRNRRTKCSNFGFLESAKVSLRMRTAKKT